MHDLPRDLELDFLAFVEDDREMPQSRRDTVRQVIARDPNLARLAAGMRTDRAALGSLRPVRAPASIMGGLEARLEQETLAAIEQRAQTVRELARSTVVIPRPGVLRSLHESGAVRRLAMAAGLAVTVGVGVWGFQRVSSWEAGGRLPGIAGRTGTRTDSAPDIANEGPDGVRASEALARGESIAEPAPDMNLPDEAPTNAIASADPGANEPADEAVGVAMTAEHATELAQAGRLAIRIRAADTDAAAREVHQVAQQSSKDVRWRPLEAAQAPSVFRALAARPAAQTGSPERSTGPDGPYWSSPLPDFIPPTPPKRTASAAEFIRRHPDMRALYTVEIPERPQELASLLGALTPGSAQVAEFVELEEAIPPMPSTEPGAVLWWGRAPANWVRRASVPIVVESLRK